MSVTEFFLIGVHVLLAWVMIEAFVNLAHHLSRPTFIVWHYLVDVVAFFGMFWVFFTCFHGTSSVFAVTAVGMTFVLFYEMIVFRYLYCGDRWFLNWVDWIVPMFLVLSSMYAAGVLFA